MNFVDFYPKKVYRCECLADVVACCLIEKTLSFKDICHKANQIEGEKVYSVKCGQDNCDVVLSCSAHMPMGIFAVRLWANNVVLIDVDNFCLKCIKNYLTNNYYTFNYVTFKE